MRHFLLYRQMTSLSAKKLATLLNISSGQYIEDKVDLLIRWGSSEKIRFKPKKILNKRKSILNCVNKRESNKILKNKGIDVPKIYNNSNIEFPCIIRSINHSRGRDFSLIESYNSMPITNEQTHYISEFFNKVNDYRLLIFKDYLLRGYIWVKNRNAISNNIIRNDDNGWTMCNIALQDFPKGLITKGFEAMDVMNLDFGAVDMGIDKSGRIVVYEINTGPFLDDNRLQLMSNAIKNFAEREGITIV